MRDRPPPRARGEKSGEPAKSPAGPRQPTPGRFALDVSTALPTLPRPSRAPDYFTPQAGIAGAALRGEGAPLPHLERIQASFGPEHDLSTVRSFAGPAAADAGRRLGARAFAVSERVAFASAPTAALAAHEATHVVQQRHGLVRRTDPLALERQADAVAARVSAGASAADLLPSPASTPAAPAAALQCSPDPQAQEAERAAAEMWGLVNDIDRPGAEVEFVFFTSSGAMTLVSYRHTAPGSGSAGSVSLDDFKRDTLGFQAGSAAGSTLVTFVGTSERYFSLTLKRSARKWDLTAWGEAGNRGFPSTPPEGRTVPNAAGAGWPVDVVGRVQTAVAPWIPLLHAYPGGTSEFEFSVTFDDDRLTRLTPLGQTYSGGRGPAFAPAAPFTSTLLNNAILAFSQGLGERTIRFRLHGEAQAHETHWRVVEAATDRGPAPVLPDEAEVIVADYRRMHAEIIRLWREGVKDAAVYAGMFGAEQLAFWLIGGVVSKGLGVVFEAAAPRLIGLVRSASRGKSRAGIEYLETMVARLPAAERAEMQGLARKMETEGVEALGKAERQTLERLLKKLEGLIEAPLTTAEKTTLRGRMGTRFNAAKPGVDALFQSAGRSYQIHHRLPLEWSHRFPGIDPNAGKNLIALETDVHRGVNAVWTRLRASAPADKVSGNVVSRTMDIVDKHFKKWYDSVPSGSGRALETEVLAARDAALAEIDALVRAL